MPGVFHSINTSSSAAPAQHMGSAAAAAAPSFPSHDPIELSLLFSPTWPLRTFVRPWRDLFQDWDLLKILRIHYRDDRECASFSNSKCHLLTNVDVAFRWCDIFAWANTVTLSDYHCTVLLFLQCWHRDSTIWELALRVWEPAQQTAAPNINQMIKRRQKKEGCEFDRQDH